MTWGVLAAVAALALIGAGMLYWNNRQARQLGKASERERVRDEADRLQRMAEKARARKPRTGTDLLDSLQNRGRGADGS